MTWNDPNENILNVVFTKLKNVESKSGWSSENNLVKIWSKIREEYAEDYI